MRSWLNSNLVNSELAQSTNDGAGPKAGVFVERVICVTNSEHLRVRDSGMTAAVWFGWLALFLGLELPAAKRVVPWKTLSEFCWTIEDDEKPTRWLFMLGLCTLLVHIVSKWPGPDVD